MKNKKLLIASGVTFCVAIVFAVILLFLNISEFSIVQNTDSKLFGIVPILIASICMIIVAITLLIIYLFNIEQKIVKRILCFEFIVTIIVSLVIPLSTVRNTEYGNDFYNPETTVSKEYSKYFPYDDTLSNITDSNTEFYYKKSKILGNTYCHIQNALTTENIDITYDVEYFSSPTSLLKSKFKAERQPTSTGKSYTRKNIKYNVYMTKSNVDVTIDNKCSFYIFHISNYPKINKNIDHIIDTAIEQYQMYS